jgi:hypothetical protein
MSQTPETRCGCTSHVWEQPLKEGGNHPQADFWRYLYWALWWVLILRGVRGWALVRGVRNHPGSNLQAASCNTAVFRRFLFAGRPASDVAPWSHALLG